MKKRKIRIEKYKDKWRIDFRDLSNKRHRKVFKTRFEAMEAARKIGYTLEASHFVKKPDAPIVSVSNISLKDAINRYVETCVDQSSGHFKRTQKYHFEKLFVFLVNEKKISLLKDIEAYHLESFKSFLKNAKNFKGATINRMFATYSPFFKKSLLWGLIAKNPMEGILKEKEIPPAIRRWDEIHKAKLIDKAPLWAKECLGFMALTGCRPIDVSRAKWGDVDFDKKVIRFISKKGNVYLESYSPINESLCEFLKNKQLVERRKFRGRDEDFIFTNSKGRPVTTDALSKQVRKIRGTDLVTPYGLRHAFIDDLVNLNIHPRDIQLLARHKKFETTERYTHRKTAHLQNIVNLFDGQKVIGKGD